MSDGSAWGPRRNEVLENIREQFGIRERQHLQDQVYQKTKYRDGLQDEIERRIYGDLSITINLLQLKTKKHYR